MGSGLPGFLNTGHVREAGEIEEDLFEARLVGTSSGAPFPSRTTGTGRLINLDRAVDALNLRRVGGVCRKAEAVMDGVQGRALQSERIDLREVEGDFVARSAGLAGGGSHRLVAVHDRVSFGCSDLVDLAVDDLSRADLRAAGVEEELNFVGERGSAACIGVNVKDLPLGHVVGGLRAGALRPGALDADGLKAG